MQKLTTLKRLNIADAVTRLHTAKALLAASSEENDRLRSAVKSMTSVLAIYFALSANPPIQERHQPAVDEFNDALAEYQRDQLTSKSC